MIDFKKYFPDCEELSSMDDEDSEGEPSGLRPDEATQYQLESKRSPTTIKNLQLNENVPREIKKYKTYHLRSVNLNRILSNASGIDEAEIDNIYQDDRKYNCSPNFHSTRKLLTSSGSSFGGSTDNSPDGDRFSLKKSIQNRELSDFEKDNLLYLEELKERRKKLYKYYEPQVKDFPYFPLGHSKTLSSISGFARKKIPDTVYPRVGSPFPRRKEYPATAFSPSRSTSSKVLRSQSLDEEEEEDDIFDYWSHSRPNSLFRNFSEPGYESKSLKYPAHEDTCRLNNIHATDNWWSNRPASLSPIRHTQPATQMSPHCSPTPKRKATIPGGLNFKVSTYNSPFSAPSTPISVPPADSGLRSSFARKSYSRRSHSSPAPGERSSFTPLNFTMSFNNFQGLQKCRPELEAVGGQFKSILSASPEDDSRRTFLPIMPECITEYSSDEGKTQCYYSPSLPINSAYKQ